MVNQLRDDCEHVWEAYNPSGRKDVVSYARCIKCGIIPALSWENLAQPPSGSFAQPDSAMPETPLCFALINSADSSNVSSWRNLAYRLEEALIQRTADVGVVHRRAQKEESLRVEAENLLLSIRALLQIKRKDLAHVKDGWTAWCPIETAPNSGIEILVAWNMGSVEVMPSTCAHDYKEPKKDGGEYLTHWMPLPVAPTSTES